MRCGLQGGETSLKHFNFFFPPWIICLLSLISEVWLIDFKSKLGSLEFKNKYVHICCFFYCISLIKIMLRIAVLVDGC